MGKSQSQSQSGKPCWMGVDLSKKSFDAALAYPEQGFERARPVRHFEKTPEDRAAFVAWANGLEGLEGICLESTGRLSVQFVLDLEEALTAPLSIVEPSRPKQFARSLGLKQKTDRVDARVLARFGAVMRPSPTRLPERPWRELKECSRLREVLLQDRTAYAQRLQDGPESAAVRRELKQQIEAFDRRIQALERETERLLDGLPGVQEDVERMTSIPGVGTKTAAVVLAELGNLRRYKRDEVVGFAGLYPVHWDSGTSVHHAPRLAKGGGSRLRRALFMAALSAKKHCPQLKAFAERLAKAGKEKMVVLGAVMHKLLLLIRAVVVTGKAYDPQYRPG